MTVIELLPTLRDLNRVDKLRAVQFLVSELPREEEAFLEQNKDYPVWSPYDSFEAANTLMVAMDDAVNDEMFLTDLGETMNDFEHPMRYS